MRIFLLLFRQRESLSGPSFHIVPAFSLCPALLCPKVWLHFERKKQREAGMWSQHRDSTRYCTRKIVLVPSTVLKRMVSTVQHLDVLEYLSWLDSSVGRIRNACLGSDKRLKKAEDVWRGESIFHNEMPETLINQAEGKRRKKIQWQELFTGLNSMSTSVTNFPAQIWGKQ